MLYMMIEKTCPMVETSFKHIIIEDIITDCQSQILGWRHLLAGLTSEMNMCSKHTYSLKTVLTKNGHIYQKLSLTKKFLNKYMNNTALNFQNPTFDYIECNQICVCTHLKICFFHYKDIS